MSAHLHAHPGSGGKNDVAGIFAVFTGKAGCCVVTGCEPGAARRAVHTQVQHRTLRHGEHAIIARMQAGQRQSGIGRRIDPGVDTGGRARAAVEGRYQTWPGFAARQDQTNRQRDQHIPAQAMAVAAGDVGMGQRQAEFPRHGAGAMQRP
jgi:hypothetical protein